jgi:hypothetical protein
MLIEPDDDELRLFELFEMLAAKHRSDLLRKLFVEACMALAGNEEADRYDRSWGSQLPPSQPTPEMLTTAFLGRCMPRHAPLAMHQLTDAPTVETRPCACTPSQPSGSAFSQRPQRTQLCCARLASSSIE